MANTFTVSANPDTDIWRKPPTTDVFNAPTHTPPSTTARKPLRAFRSARITFSTPFVHQYDQAGLALVFHRTSGAAAATPPRWIKTGVELYNGQPRLSTVACERFADWSVAPLRDRAGRDLAPSAQQNVSVLVRREDSEGATSLWVYRLDDRSGERIEDLREICWVYADAEDDWELEVAGYVARPAKEDVVAGNGEGNKTLDVEFKDFGVEWDE